jgi:flavin reductase (DIM6/NTAB) family NADH-FMN oxidoreductase RutF
MPSIDPTQLSDVDRYRLSIAAIVPRPIAWITTCEADGGINLAPFSFFNGVCSSPITLSVSIADRDPPKDTLRNLQRSGECVVHLVRESAFAAMHESAAAFPPGESEVQALRLATQSSTVVAVPRLVDADVAFECRYDRGIRVGDPDDATTLCLLVVVHVHVAEHIADARGFPDPQIFRTWARLGGNSYLSPASWTVLDKPRAKYTPPA